MSEHPLDDDDLVALIGAALAESDPVPAHVLEAAKAVPEIAGLDAELALMSFDSDLDLAGVRSGVGTGRQLSFEADDVDIEIVVHAEERTGRHIQVVEGQLAPAAAVIVSLASADPVVGTVETQADELGRFRFDDVPTGAVRLLVHIDAADTARPVVTSWFRL